MRASSARVETCGGMARDAGSETTLGSGGSATTVGNTLAGMSLPSARAAGSRSSGHGRLRNNRHGNFRRRDLGHRAHLRRCGRRVRRLGLCLGGLCLGGLCLSGLRLGGLRFGGNLRLFGLRRSGRGLSRPVLSRFGLSRFGLSRLGLSRLGLAARVLEALAVGDGFGCDQRSGPDQRDEDRDKEDAAGHKAPRLSLCVRIWILLKFSLLTWFLDTRGGRAGQFQGRLRRR